MHDSEKISYGASDAPSRAAGVRDRAKRPRSTVRLLGTSGASGHTLAHAVTPKIRASEAAHAVCGGAAGSKGAALGLEAIGVTATDLARGHAIGVGATIRPGRDVTDRSAHADNVSAHGKRGAAGGRDAGLVSSKAVGHATLETGVAIEALWTRLIGAAADAAVYARSEVAGVAQGAVARVGATRRRRARPAGARAAGRTIGRSSTRGPGGVAAVFAATVAQTRLT